MQLAHGNGRDLTGFVPFHGFLQAFLEAHERFVALVLLGKRDVCQRKPYVARTLGTLIGCSGEPVSFFKIAKVRLA
jgi:hypothetical protein